MRAFDPEGAEDDRTDGTALACRADELLAVKERAIREKRSAGEDLSDLARQALTNLDLGAGDDEPESFYGFEPFPHRGEAVADRLIDRLR